MSEIELPNPVDLDPTFEGPTFKRTQDVEVNADPDNRPRSWEAIREECRSGGAMDDRCSIIYAQNNGGGLEVVAKKLACGCILILTDSDEVGL